MRARHTTHWIAITFIAVSSEGAGRLAAQPTAQPDSAVPAVACGEPIQCPPSYSSSISVGINLKPSGGACRFDLRTIEDLELATGQDVFWSFCNECAQEMTVQIDTPPPGPFSSFRRFTPIPDSDNRVTVNIPCYSSRGVTGSGALQAGVWKYTLRAKPAGSATFPDEIDPRLEIDDFFIPPNFQTPMWAVLAAIVGVILGYWLARRARSAF